MTQTTRWWWVRHARALNHDNRVYGNTLDVSVDTSNAVPFRALARTLPQGAILIRNKLKRTTETLEALSAQGFTPSLVRIDETIQELCFGEWQGLTYKEIREVSGGHPVWFTPVDVTPPKGESFLAMHARVIPSIERLTKEFAGRDIVSISHGGPIRLAIGHALGLNADRSLYFRVDNLSLTRLEYRSLSSTKEGNNNWHVRSINVRPDHLETA